MNYTPALQLYISTSDVHLCCKLSVCHNWVDRSGWCSWNRQTGRLQNCPFFLCCGLICYSQYYIKHSCYWRARNKNYHVHSLYPPWFVPFSFDYFHFHCFLFFFIHSLIPFPLSQGSLFQKSNVPKEKTDLGMPCKFKFSVLSLSIVLFLSCWF